MFCPRPEEASTTLGRQLISFGVQPLCAPCHESGTGCGVPFKLTSNHELSSITMGPSSHLPSPPSAQQSPNGGRLVRQRRSLKTVGRGPLAPLLRDKCLDISTHGLVWRDQRDPVGASSPWPCPCPFPGSLAVGAECDNLLGRPG